MIIEPWRRNMPMSIEHRAIVENNPDDGNPLHARLAETVGIALQMSAVLVLGAGRHP